MGVFSHLGDADGLDVELTDSDTSRKLGDALRELGYETTRTMYGYQVIGLGLETTSDNVPVRDI